MNWIKWALAGNRLSNEALHGLVVQIRYLVKRLEIHLLGNHLFANAKALVFAGLFLSGSEPDCWLNTGLRILAREVPEQILADGGHFERSPMYLLAFGAALLFSLLLTPLARNAGEFLGVMDVPGERKVHTHPIPRTGGLAIFMSFVLALTLVVVADTDISRLLALNHQRISLMIGGVICFLTGLASGVTFFTAMMMVVLSTLGGNYMVAVLFAILAGGILH